ncbi:hypothetical protein [Kitasatospora sp. MBT66]|uniref:phage tail tube protein n=1 Tax=Kitasatospora sp. MBT66 TaxID=1444769 RepID=UPI0005BB5E22|nr:hypothetical protein [Kitasatospora sp. MBT66]
MTDTRNADLSFGATDYLVFVAPLNTAAPTGFTAPPAAWLCLGWVTTDGGTLKIAEEKKEIQAAGSMEPIRTLRPKSTKTVQVTCQEALNPVVRSLYDNVPIATLKPAVGGTVTYPLPDKPDDLRYAMIFDTIDGAKKIRLYAPNAEVTERGDEKPQADDVMGVDMTFTFYKGATSKALSRSIDYGGIDVANFFPTGGGS